MNYKCQILVPLLGACCFSVNASPVISEIFYDAIGADAGNTFIELYGVPGDSLNGLVLEAVNGFNDSIYLDIVLNGVFPDDGIYVIGDEVSGATNVSGADFLTDVNLQNGPDSVVLRSNAVILDALAYGDFSAGLFSAGEGGAAEDVSAGFSLARYMPWQDTNNNAVDFLSAVPTPGSIPINTIPLPTGLMLFISGFLALFGIGRRCNK